MAVSAAILCQAVCVFDIMNKAETSGGRSVYYGMNKPFLYFDGKLRINTAAPWEALIRRD